MELVLFKVYTFPEAPSLSTQDLSCIESLVIHLHTGNSSAEISPVANASSHSGRVVSGESYTTDVFTRRKFSIEKQFCSPRSSIIRCTDKLPSPRYHSSSYHRFGETASSATREPYK